MKVLKMDTAFLFSGHKAILSGDGVISDCTLVLVCFLKLNNIHCGQ
jgi:hypothetical protein